jgi:hypothetical protein
MLLRLLVLLLRRRHWCPWAGTSSAGQQKPAATDSTIPNDSVA